MNRLIDIASAKAPFTLSLTWNNGKKQTVDLSGLVAHSDRFRVFAEEPETFREVSVINWGHGIEWENGLDLSAESLAFIAAEQTGEDGRALIAEFQRRFHLTNEDIGLALGYKKSQIKNFKAGVSPVTPAVRVAVRAMLAQPAVFYARMAASYVRPPK